MEQDPRQRANQRQEQRNRRQAQQKKNTIRLIGLGAVLLVALVVLIVLLSRCGTGSADPTDPGILTEPPTLPPVTSQPPEETAPLEEQTVIHFVAAGDLNVTEKTVGSGGINYDYTQAFLDVAPLFANADLSTLNFEGNLCGAPYGSTASAPQNMAYALQKMGVDMVQLANSYSINRGVSGLRTTIESVRSAGMEPIGVFPDQSAYADCGGYSLFQIKGVKIAVVAFTKGMDGTTLPPGSENLVNVLYSDYNKTYQKVNTEKITAVLEAAAAAQPDITIALLHWGSEFNDTISKTQTSICNLMLSNGVDAIIGTHPHYVQKMVFDPEAGTFVAYSLGDFFGDVPRAGSEYSVVLDLEITKNNKTGKTAITGFSYTPIFTVREEGQQMRVLRIDAAITAYKDGYINRVNEDTYEDMLYALTRIEARVNAE